LITFFTIPRPFKGHHEIIQTNAILSWTKLDIECEIIIFGDEPSVIQFAQNNNIKCISNYQSNSYGTPLLDGIWKLANESCKNDLICYINTDIILFPEFPIEVKKIKLEEFLLAGRRWDLDINYKIDFKSDWTNQLKSQINNNGKLHPETGTDYFLFPKNIMPTLPPFAIGRGVWDNWLLRKFKKSSIPLIDGTSILTVHQNHDYSHIKSLTKISPVKGKERLTNLELSNLKYWEILFISDADYLFVNERIIEVKIQKKIKRFLYRYLFLTIKIVAKKLLFIKTK